MIDLLVQSTVPKHPLQGALYRRIPTSGSCVGSLDADAGAEAALMAREVEEMDDDELQEMSGEAGAYELDEDEETMAEEMLRQEEARARAMATMQGRPVTLQPRRRRTMNVVRGIVHIPDVLPVPNHLSEGVGEGTP